jgi:L-ribulose-5-phosphate 3-epimerase
LGGEPACRDSWANEIHLIALKHINRRQFVEIAGASALLSSLPFAAKPQVAARFKKSLKIGMVGVEGTLRDKFMLLKELGFDGIELDSPNDLDPDEVLRAKEDSGLLIPGVVDSVHWKWTLGDADESVRAQGRKGLETAIRDCKTYGGSTVLLVPGVVNAAWSYDQVYERTQVEIARVLPLAEELQIKIAFENVWNQFLLSPLEAAAYVDSFKSPWVGWYFDVGNVVNYGWPEQWIRILGPRLLKLDIKEFSRTKRDQEGLWKGFAVELGEGDNNWPAVRDALNEIGYSGWASAEVQGGDKERLREISTRMDHVLGLG